MPIVAALILSVSYLITVPPPMRSPADIHSVDFRNFTYKDVCDTEGKTTTVHDGSYYSGDEMDKVYFEIRDVVYGDVTGDGSDEALVLTLCNTGGTGQFTDGLLFAMRAGKPQVIATLGVGDRADGGIDRAVITGGRLIVDRFAEDGSGACCPERVETYSYRWNGTKLVQTAPPAKRSYQYYGRDDTPAPHDVRFLKGTSSATLNGVTNAGESYRIGARAGQSYSIALTSKDRTASLTLAGPDGAELGSCGPGAKLSGKLPASGNFIISVKSRASQDDPNTDYDIDVEIK